MAVKRKGALPPKGQTHEGDHYLSAIADLQFRLNAHQRVWSPPTDLFETPEAMVVTVEAPGMREEDFSLSFSNGILRVRGIRQEPPGKVAYHRMEICYGEFLTEVAIPKNIEKQSIEAVYARGFLRITLPKVGPKKIHVRDG